ncbi:NAD-dependent epimerase/dehydratase family protein [Lentilitoribacter sp. EG35]|uniref:NAD-dependent epimerase/dehydratase family protein n=1 Tax=Lentilitoribacter sp. EG35 TaxID=3234192 RepID=UPI0034611B0B
MTNPIYDTSKPALVTGATGYIAGWLVKGLLEQGITVHAAVRDPSNKEKLAHLTALVKDNPEQLKFFKADLLNDGAYDEAMAGCGVVFHTASPFTSSFKDAQKELVDPAVNGTRNVLETANRTDSVSRVVVTSSCAAIYGDAIDCQSMPNGTLTEEIWNTTSRLDHQAYSYSKTQAEKAAWDIAKAQDRWKLVVINPAFVMGPGVTLQPNSESVAVMKQLGDGTMKMGVPHFEIGIVDVRDVAEAHMRAGYIADAEGRHITSAKTMTLLEMGQTLEKKFGSNWPFPKSTAPKWLLWLVGPIANKMFTREMISKNVGHAWKADNTKSKEKLGITYRSTETAVIEMFDQMIDAGVFKK